MNQASHRTLNRDICSGMQLIRCFSNSHDLCKSIVLSQGTSLQIKVSLLDSV